MITSIRSTTVRATLFPLLLACINGYSNAASQAIPSSAYSAMRWRLIGPHRAGRVTGVSGVSGQPSVYYISTPGGGVWKTEDGGRVWKPIFDDAHVASIGTLAVSQSNPRVIYVGTGEQSHGNGIYKSTDGGSSWTQIGLQDLRFIDAILIHPHNPDVILVAGSGDYPPSPVGGVFKTTDGGKTWQKVLSRPDATGAADLCFDPDNPDEVFAALWHRDPDSYAQPTSPEPDGWAYRSSDGGSSWKLVSENGWPSGSVGRIGVAVAAKSSGKRVYAIVKQGLFLSEDAGANWHQITKDPRIIGTSYFSRVFVDPINSDTVFIAQTSLYRSVDGGKTFEAYVGAPSGDDFHVLWINPSDNHHMILGIDQGAIISVDGGATWTSWFNQPTGQFYNVSADNYFPFHLYAAQQDSGTVAVPLRSDYGEISYRDWFSPGGFEIGYIVADPMNPDLVFAAGWFNTVVRFDKRTGQVLHVFVPEPQDRLSMIMPMAFSPHDPQALYLGTHRLMRTIDGGMKWEPVSPDLTRGPGPKDEKKTESFTAPKHAISTVSLSPVNAEQVWVGTDDGLIQLTQDGGKTWINISPSEITPRSTVVMLDASHHDPGTAYCAVIGFHDVHPYAYRTHDSGKTWQKIVNGLPDGSEIRVVREDPVRGGLLYAGTETGVYVSFNDGDFWQPVQLNLPTSSVRDLVIVQNDLAAATFGRGLWVLDDLSPLRQLTTTKVQNPVQLFRPSDAIRVRWDVNQDTPLPPETPVGQNPPDGAVFDYFLKNRPQGEITLSIYDNNHQLIRQFTSTSKEEPAGFPNVPSFWFSPSSRLPKEAGHNRFVWDLRYESPPTLPYGYFGEQLDYIEYTLADHAIPGETPRQQPEGPFIVPGEYEVVLTVDGQSFRQPLKVEMDPRVRVAQADLVRQLEMSRSVSRWTSVSYAAHNKISELRRALAERENALVSKQAAKDLQETLKSLDADLSAIEGGTAEVPGFGLLNRDLVRLETMIDSGDGAPSSSMQVAADESCRHLKQDLLRWSELQNRVSSQVNGVLERQLLPALAVSSSSPEITCEQ
jgi:photosystem II stability/assembly factor-like uncharacterized protein